MNLNDLISNINRKPKKSRTTANQPQHPVFPNSCSEATVRLRAENTELLTEIILNEESYYGVFFRFLKNGGKMKKAYKELLFQNCLKDEEFKEGIAYRAALIFLKNKYSTSYDLAANLFPLVGAEEINLSLADCCEIVVENYLDMLHADRAHPIVGRFDKQGFVQIVEGHHRALINLAAGFEMTPVLLLAPTMEWQEFVDFFRTEGMALYGDENALYHKIKHSDFVDFHVVREDRSHPIIECLRKRNFSHGLDLGSMIGFYSHEIARQGISMKAIEFESKYAEKAIALGRLYQLDDLVDVRCEDIYDCSYLADGNEYDFVLMLSILYHLLRRNEHECMEWLVKMQQRFQNFIIDTEQRTGILGAEKLFALFPNFDHELLFSGADDRDIYLLTRR